MHHHNQSHPNVTISQVNYIPFIVLAFVGLKSE